MLQRHGSIGMAASFLRSGYLRDCLMLTVELAKAAQKTLGSTFTVSIRPDFPHLIAAPDIVVGGKGRLVGFFIPSESEARDVTGLLVRLALCRLGLPVHLRCVFVDKGLGIHKDGTSKWDYVRPHFDSFVPASELRDSLDHELLSSGAGPRSDPAFAKTRHRCAQRSASLLNVSVSHHKAHSAQRSSTSLLVRLMDQSGYSDCVTRPWLLGSGSGTPGNIRSSSARIKAVAKNGRVVGYESFEGQTKPMQALRFFVDLSVQNDYVLRDGLPEFRRPATRVLAYRRLPLGRRDPLKLMRAAAFAGWAMVAVSAAAEAEAILQDLESQLK
jgi:hypothetical protein